jgi:prepilin-type N-terminal cleavage/methylation domain-containing protein/prepilin-type processing-associated H-X9-DG protein
MARRSPSGFTLVEILIVLAIISILAAMLFPVFVGAKAAAKGADCLSNVQQIGEASMLYVADNDGQYPQTKRSSGDPAIQDADGGIEDPDYGDVFVMLHPYVGNRFITEAQLSSERLYACPEDINPFGSDCLATNPDTPSPTSYLINGYYVWGFAEISVAAPSSTIFLAERRSAPTAIAPAYCDAIYRPWFNSSNPDAPEDEMDGANGAVATKRHNGHATYGFADGHVKSMTWAQTFALPNVNMHDPSLGG